MADVEDVVQREPWPYTTAFFLVQGIAAAATARFQPKGWLVVPAIVATLAFNLASSVLFFASVNQVAPFYTGQVPNWLAGW